MVTCVTLRYFCSSQLRTFSTESLDFLNGTLRNETRGRVILEPCCQFSKQTPCEMAQIFREADIVIGMHGAGNDFKLHNTY